MDNSFVNDSVFILLRQKITEAYEESKRNINTLSSSIIKSISQIKGESEQFHSKCIDIISSIEKDQPSTVNESIQKAFASKCRNGFTREAKTSPVIKQEAHSHSLSKTKQSKQSKNDVSVASPPSHLPPSLKTTTSTELSRHYKNEKPLLFFNISKVKRKDIHPNCFNSNLICSKVNASHGHPSANATYSANRNQTESDTANRNESRKMTTNEVKRFSIIDIPCLNIEEANQNAKKATATSKATPKSTLHSKLRYKQMPGVTESKKEVALQRTNSSQLCYIMAKEGVVPLKLRLLFGSSDKAVYTFYPPSDIFQSYEVLISKKLKEMEREEEAALKFNPSLTALSSLHFVNEKQEKIFLQSLATQSFSDHHRDILQPIINLLLLLFQIESSTRNEFSEERLIPSFIQLLQEQSLKKLLLSIDIANVPEEAITDYIEIYNQSPSIFDVKVLEKIDSLLSKICFFLEEAHEYFCLRRSFVNKRDQYIHEKKLLEEKLLFAKMQG